MSEATEPPCEACSIEARIGTEEVPHPIDQRLHTCVCEVPIAQRPAVRWFAVAMERELRENDHKGTWDRCTLGYLAKRLREEVEELVSAATDGHINANIGDEGYRVTQWTESDAGRVLSEAADVGNFAMMIADVCASRSRSLQRTRRTAPDGRSTTTIKVDNPTDEPILVLATMAGVVSEGKFEQTRSTELRAWSSNTLAFLNDDVEAIRRWTEDDDVCHSVLGRLALRGLLAEIDRLRRGEATLLAYGRALRACDAASDRGGDAEYEADVAMEKAFEEIVEVSKRLAEKERLP